MNQWWQYPNCGAQYKNTCNIRLPSVFSQHSFLFREKQLLMWWFWCICIFGRLSGVHMERGTTTHERSEQRPSNAVSIPFTTRSSLASSKTSKSTTHSRFSASVWRHLCSSKDCRRSPDCFVWRIPSPVLGALWTEKKTYWQNQMAQTYYVTSAENNKKSPG